MADFSAGKDEYKKMASTIFNIKESEVTKDQRQFAKAIVLGCQFGMQGKTLKATCYQWGIDITSTRAEELVKIYRRLRPNIVNGWDECMNLVRTAIKNPNKAFHLNRLIYFKVDNGDLKIRLPSGRVLYYIRIKEENNGYKFSFVSGGNQCYLTMNTLVNNLVQSIARDVLCFHCIKLEKNGFKVSMHVHDEFVVESKEDQFKLKQFNDILKINPEWADGLPLEIEGEFYSRYGKY